MAATADERFIQTIANHLLPMTDLTAVDSILKSIGDRRFVFLGEATHGTAEFYAVRRAVTQALIRDAGLRIVGLEADWPEAQLFSRYVRGNQGGSAVELLRKPRRWPTWMWSNTEFARLMDWMRDFNRRRPDKALLYGIDLYSLFESMDEILKIVRRRDPGLAHALSERYECFNPFERDERAYARSLLDLPAGCREEVLANLHAILGLRLGRIHIEERELFDVEQNAHVVANAERYYRAIIDDDESSWNIRDRHMLDTLERLTAGAGPDSRCAVWAHNTHIGDYRGTSMHDKGFVNIGGLARERFGPENVSLIGFSTYRGSVLAGPHWDGDTTEMSVPPAREGSLDALFEAAAKRVGTEAFFLPIDGISEELAAQPIRAQRAIGVVYDPYHERITNYVPTRLEKRYDGLVFISETRALTEIGARAAEAQPPQTWPTGH